MAIFWTFLVNDFISESPEDLVFALWAVHRFFPTIRSTSLRPTPFSLSSTSWFSFSSEGCCSNVKDAGRLRVPSGVKHESESSREPSLVGGGEACIGRGVNPLDGVASPWLGERTLDSVFSWLRIGNLDFATVPWLKAAAIVSLSFWDPIEASLKSFIPVPKIGPQNGTLILGMWGRGLQSESSIAVADRRCEFTARETSLNIRACFTISKLRHLSRNKTETRLLLDHFNRDSRLSEKQWPGMGGVTNKRTSCFGHCS